MRANPRLTTLAAFTTFQKQKELKKLITFLTWLLTTILLLVLNEPLISHVKLNLFKGFKEKTECFLNNNLFSVGVFVHEHFLRS